MSRALPEADAFGGPDQGSGAFGGGEFGEFGDVDLDELLGLGVGERSPQGGADGLFARWADGPGVGRQAGEAGAGGAGRFAVTALPCLGGGVLKGAAGGVVLAGLFVVVVDGGEHGLDVGDAEPVQAYVAEVGGEVEADMGLVRAAGGGAQVGLGGEPFGQPLADRHLLVQGLPDQDLAAELVVGGQWAACFEGVVDEGDDGGAGLAGVVGCRGEGEQVVDVLQEFQGVVLGVEAALSDALGWGARNRGQVEQGVPGAMVA